MRQETRHLELGLYGRGVAPGDLSRFSTKETCMSIRTAGKRIAMNGRGLHHHAPVTPDEVLAETLRLRPAKRIPLQDNGVGVLTGGVPPGLLSHRLGLTKASTLIAAAFKVSACGEILVPADERLRHPRPSRRGPRCQSSRMWMWVSGVCG